MFYGHIKGLAEEIGTGDNLGKVKVKFPYLDGFVSDWLPVLQSLTLGANTWSVPRKGTQVIVLTSDTYSGIGNGLEDAVVLGAIYSKVDKPPFDDTKIIGMVADDGVEISYDPTASKLTIESPKLIKIISTNIDIQSDIKIQGNIDIQGDIKLQGDSDIQGDTKQTGNVKLTGDIKQSGSITTDSAIIGGIVFAAHKHPGVMSGPAVSGVPV
jgi:phage baseplate assembly protein V